MLHMGSGGAGSLDHTAETNEIIAAHAVMNFDQFTS